MHSFYFFFSSGNPRLIGSRVCSTLGLRPGAQCCQGQQARKASCRGGSRPRKTPRPQAVAGRLPARPAHQSLASELPGAAWPGASSCYWVPLQRAPETKQSPVLKETQSGLFTEPCNDLEQHRLVFSRRKGASRNIRHRVHHV